MTLEFKGFPKIARLRRPVVVTEKVDGTHGAIVIDRLPDNENLISGSEVMTTIDEINYRVRAQSRKRFVTPKDDNYGFGRWVWHNAELLTQELGEGTHFGEWWGHGVQRGYGLDHKNFSLFNAERWKDTTFKTETGQAGQHDLTVEVGPVPVLATSDVFDTASIEDVVKDLGHHGSSAAPGFMRPEGVVVYHKASNTLFKRLIENDELPKGVVENDA